MAVAGGGSGGGYGRGRCEGNTRRWRRQFVSVALALGSGGDGERYIKAVDGCAITPAAAAELAARRGRGSRICNIPNHIISILNFGIEIFFLKKYRRYSQYYNAIISDNFVQYDFDFPNYF